MTPTREQVIEWAEEAGLSFDDGWLFYTPKRPSLPEAEIDAFIAAMNVAYTAGREQGLREAKEVCEAKALASALAHVNTDEQAFHIKAEAARSCAAAIEQLRGE